MRTSNIIIIAFFVFIIGSMFTLFVDAKNHKKEEVENPTTSYKEYPLQSFSVIVAEKGSDLHIDQSDKTSISIEYVKDKKTPVKLYQVSNDTLFVYGGLRTFVKCEKITDVVSNRSFWIGISKFNPDTVIFKLNGGRIFFDNGNDPKRIHVGVIAKGAYCEIKNSNVQIATVKSDSSEVALLCLVNLINADLNHVSRLRFKNNTGTIVAKTDSTSHLITW